MLVYRYVLLLDIRGRWFFGNIRFKIAQFCHSWTDYMMSSKEIISPFNFQIIHAFINHEWFIDLLAGYISDILCHSVFTHFSF